MKTNPFNIEYPIAGFSHLLWLTLLALWLLDIPLTNLISFLTSIESGTAVILVATLGGISFFLGFLAEHFLVWGSYLINKKERGEKIDSYRNQVKMTWSAKSFFRSMAFAILGIAFFLLVWIKFEISKYYWAIIVV
jgi:hypothetical protein